MIKKEPQDEKGLIALLLMLVVLGTCTGALAKTDAFSREQTTSDGIAYVIDEGNNVTVTGYQGKASDLVIPDFFGKDWSILSRIAVNAFAGNEKLTSVTIKGGVMVVIDTGAFDSCVNLAQLALPEGIWEIRENAFRGAALTELTLPKGIMGISAQAFGGCNALLTITFQGTELPEILDAEAFAWDQPNSERTIRCYQGSAVDSWAQACGYAVEYLSQSEECTFSVTDDGRIYGYQGHVADLVIPAEINGIPVRAINNWVFYGNTFLTSVTLPEGLTPIDNDSFGGCPNLAEVNLPSTLTHLGAGAFSDCISLKQIVLPEGLQVLEDVTFARCSALESVTPPRR